MTRVRCAIYTRKSSEDGLEQGFNSLHAQREACEAYIASQRHEGWELLPDQYDDGGISGGHLDRPGLQRLMEAVDAKQVDQIVVYKIDRLTRSLADFAKLVERLDVAGASFVSVTQSFNTSTSMGRLTLNVLLSFAQFEREVTAERIRDKIAASKRKGLWMGGNVPLGYEPNDRTLKILPEEAEVVRRIYDLYEATRSISDLRDEAETLQIRSKRHTKADGTTRGGHIMSRGQLHHILTNPIYAGRIRHKGQVFEGQHEAIIDPDRWDRLQGQMQDQAAKPRQIKQHRDPSPLAGKIYDGAGERLTPSHTKKGGRRYRYYISKRLVTGVTSAQDKQRTWRIPAPQIEDAILGAVRTRLSELKARRDDQVFNDALTEVITPKQIWPVIEQVTIDAGQITIALDPEATRRLIGQWAIEKQTDLILTIPFTERRRGVEIRFVAQGTTSRDETLLRNIANAHHWYQQLKQGASFDDLAQSASPSKRRIQQMIPLAFLAPEITRQVTQGTQPLGLTSDWLLRHSLPTEWIAQQDRIARLYTSRLLS